MQHLDTRKQLSKILGDSVSEETHTWIENKLDLIIKSKSAKELYLSYSLLAGKIDTAKKPRIQGINQELARISDRTECGPAPNCQDLSS